MIDDFNPFLRSICRYIYHQCSSGLFSKSDSDTLEDLFMQTTGAYRYYELQKIDNPVSSGENVEKIQNIIKKLCEGEYSANQEIKSFLLRKRYITEDNGDIKFSSSFILQTPSNNLLGGYTKMEDNGNLLIVINQQSVEGSEDSLAIMLGHEICHQIINERIKKNITSSEVEALCDIVGMIAAKGSGYTVQQKIAEDERNYSREEQKKMFSRYYPDCSSDDIEKLVDKHMMEVIEKFYVPSKLKQIAEFVDDKVPTVQNKIPNPIHSLFKDYQLSQ